MTITVNDKSNDRGHRNSYFQTDDDDTKDRVLVGKFREDS